MSDSSANADDLFAGLRVVNVEALITVCEGVHVCDLSYVRRRYSELATDFEATVTCLSRLGVIRRDDTTIALISDTQDRLRKVDLRGWLLKRIVNAQPYAKRLFAYFRAFRVTGGRIAWRAGASSSDHYSDVRDILMDCGVVYFEQEKGAYLLAQEYTYLFAQSLRDTATISPDALRKSLAMKHALGEKAELAVIHYERERVGPAFAQQVVHTSATDVSAGFDIESVTISDGWPLPRYIEVKAVSGDDYHFCWTANEIRVAGLLAECYFLYLIPVGADGSPGVEKMLVIKDPCREVLAVDGEWSVISDDLSCRLKRVLSADEVAYWEGSDG